MKIKILGIEMPIFSLHNKPIEAMAAVGKRPSVADTTEGVTAF